jgi:hypothetical protein
MVKRVVAGLALVLAAAGLVSLLWLAPRWMPVPTDGPCPTTTAPGTLQPAPAGRPPDLALKPGQSSKLALGRSLGHKSRQLQFEVDGGSNVLQQGALLAVDFDPFIRGDDTELSPADYSARAEFKDGRVRLTICLARSGGATQGNGSPNTVGPIADAGTYTGTVSIIDPRVARTDVPFTFTLAYPYWPVVVAIAFVTEVVAVCWIWILRRDDSAKPVMGGEFWSWLKSGAGITSASVAAVAGAGALIAIYFNSETWAFDIPGMVALISGVFAGFVTAATAQTVASKARQPPGS